MTTHVLRPNETVEDDNADQFGGGGGDFDGKLSDDSDGTYIRLDNSNSYDDTILGFETVALGAAVTKTLAVRVRYSEDGRFRLRTFLAETPGTLQGSASFERSDAGVIVEASGSSFPVALLQADIDALRVTTERFAGPDRPFLYELALDLVTVAQPIVAVDAPTTPFTDSTTVPASWVNTLDSDGGAQTRYEVRVTESTATDADTDIVYESGVLTGSATSHDTGPLGNGESFKQWVRVAQTVNGTQHWSDWDDSAVFTMDVDTADISSVTLTPVDADGKITVQAVHDATSQDWEIIEIQRSIDAGTTWVDVRSVTYLAFASLVGPDEYFTPALWQVDDYEVPNGADVKYRARATYISGDLPITGSWVESGTDQWSSDLCWLKSPLDPSKNMTVRPAQPVPADQRTVRAGVFDVIGSEYPVVVSDVLSAASTSLLFFTDDVDDIAAVRDLLADVNMLWHPIPAAVATHRYVAVRGVTEALRVPFYDERRRWSIPVVEIDVLPDPTAGR